MAFSITAPNGISISQNEDFVYYTTPDGKLGRIASAELLSPEQQKYFVNATDRNFNGLKQLQSQYGIDFTTLPRVNPTDMDQVAKTLNGTGSNGVPQYDNSLGFSGVMNGLLHPQAGGGITQNYNTDPSVQNYTNPNVVNPTTGTYQAQPAPQAAPAGQSANPNANYFAQGQGGNPTGSSTGSPSPTTGTTGGATGAPGASSRGATGASGSPDLSGLPPEFQQLYSQLNDYLAKLQQNGQVLNPNIQLDPTHVAQFLSQAQSEINPYYAGQLKLAQDDLSRSLTNAQQTNSANEASTQRAYSSSLRTLGENAADQGFAQSGIRNRQEGDLATNTQATLDAGRRDLNFGATNAASGFARQYGTAALPSMNIGATPQVSTGESTFGSSGRQLPLYQLSPDVYNGLTGSQQYQQQADITNRASQLEGAFNSNQAINQARQLTI